MFNRLTALIAVCALVGAFALSASKPIGVVHAQGSPPDQSSGFAGTLINTGAAATVVSAVNLSTAIGGPATTGTVSGRIHLKHVHAYGATATALQLQEHPSSGSNKFICNIGLGTALPTTVKAGNNEALGLTGYLTAPGSTIVVVSTAASSVAALTLTYSIE